MCFRTICVYSSVVFSKPNENKMHEKPIKTRKPKERRKDKKVFLFDGVSGDIPVGGGREWMEMGMLTSHRRKMERDII